MTRKEVCKATGLSVKTLRLYEEKGLIAPAREYRNGREYRTYTPKLVEQLSQIATLRRRFYHGGNQDHAGAARKNCRGLRNISSGFAFRSSSSISCAKRRTASVRRLCPIWTV